MRLLAISKNTFIETLRQPIYAVIIVFSLLLMLLAPAVSMYTLDEDIMLLRELGLSTLFLAGLFIAVFASTGAITEEIESGTITTVLSKPISRPTFVIGKFLGISMAVALSHLLITMALLMIVRHGTLETASDEIDWTVITAAGAGILATLIITGNSTQLGAILRCLTSSHRGFFCLRCLPWWPLQSCFPPVSTKS
ncbi:MAG: ABC transporter permease [Planctomycetota bacterium]